DMDMPLKAEPEFIRTLKIDPEYKGANLMLGIIAEEHHKNYKKAISYYEAEVKVDDENAEAHRRLGDLYRQYVMDFASAEKHLKRALELRPNDVTAMINYANTLYNMGKTMAAIDMFERALQVKPDDLTANFNLALLYEYVGKKQLAIDRFKRFLKLNPPERWADEARQHLKELQQ
ncbi:TPA: tetratricopeptide repeat protein, partial [Candidatus Poribacteria bacterium]|nr:tetratricopeptide repeat protein [Candidatus Poribacteria bacterium]HEX30093.1 tetratricopeptide repeat protein [Candidatus Poribacteria bacterium]